MAVDLETIYGNLYARLTASVTGVLTFGRRLRHFDNVPPAEQPALFLDQTDVDIAGEGGLPGRMVAHANVYLYWYQDDATGPMPTLNGLLLQVSRALERDASDPGAWRTGPTTLGGTVASVRITSVEAGTADATPQGIAIVGLEIVAAA